MKTDTEELVELCNDIFNWCQDNKDSLRIGNPDEEIKTQKAFDFEKPKSKLRNQLLDCVFKDIDCSPHDIELFESTFEDWDHNLLVLERILYSENIQGEKYVVVTTEGIYDNIGTLARQLQTIISGYEWTAHCFGDELFIMQQDTLDKEYYHEYRISFHSLNMPINQKYQEGLKWEIK